MNDLADKLIYAELLQKKIIMEEELPHLYGWKWYQWAWDYFNSTARNQFICAANQITKSSTQIRKAIELAGNNKKWSKFFGRKPTQFWFIYTSLDVATIEFDEKWVKEFLPRGSMKEHELYGWIHEKKSGKIHCIRFNSGVTIYFKSYEQGGSKGTKLQSSTVDAIFCDEEMPEYLYDEVSFRRNAAGSDGGMFSMCFTATLGEPMWHDTIEMIGMGKEAGEKFVGAFKRQVSMYDCEYFMDGSPSQWTKKRIQEIIDSCKNEKEVQRRVFGRFVKDEGLAYGSFMRSKNYKLGHEWKHLLHQGWTMWTGVDVGSGGTKGHPASVVFVIVDSEFKRGRICFVWRGDGEETTAGDIYEKYLAFRGDLQPVSERYDWASKDFYTVASRGGKTGFEQADKDRKRGQEILNTLFKNGQLILWEGGDSGKLAYELETLREDAPKNKAKDDAIDALRYAITTVPWVFEDYDTEKVEVIPEVKDVRLAFWEGTDNEDAFFGDETEQAISELNEMLDYLN